MAEIYTTRKFDGDDAYSWAVFRKADVKGIKGIVFRGQAKPAVCGCSRSEAKYHASRLNREGK